MSATLPGPIWLAYFYKPNSIPVDGWRDRKTVRCHPDGSCWSRDDYDDLIREGWVYLGHAQAGSDTTEIWRKAHV